MADGVFSLKNIFTTAALALAIDLLFVFPVSHFSAWGKSITTTVAGMYGFIPTAGTAAANAATAAVATGPAGVML